MILLTPAKAKDLANQINKQLDMIFVEADELSRMVLIQNYSEDPGFTVLALQYQEATLLVRVEIVGENLIVKKVKLCDMR